MHKCSHVRQKLVCFTALLAIVSATGGAQRPNANATTINMDALAKMAPVAQAMSALQADNAWTIGKQIALCEIPAPPFKEDGSRGSIQERAHGAWTGQCSH